MRLERALGATALGLGVLAAILGGNAVPAGDSGEVGALEVARAIRDDPAAIAVVDVRDRAAYDELHIPRAVHAPARLEGSGTDLSAAEWRGRLEALGVSVDQLVVVAGSPETPTRALWAELRGSGYRALHMPEMLADWIETIVSPTRGPTDDPVTLARWKEQAELARYFGGFPRVTSDAPERDGTVRQRLRHARRRGCAI